MEKTTEIFAHRGYSTAYPENTMIAFIAAEKLGVDGIEIDVQLSKDEQLVVIHDLTLERTTSGKGKVLDYPIAELKKLSAGSWFSLGFQNERIPLLEEVLKWATKNSLKINIELKSTASQRKKIILKIVEVIKGSSLEHRVILSSFDHELIHQLARKLPQVQTAAITLGTLYKPELYLQMLCTNTLHYHYPMLTREAVEHLITKGINLRAFTVNDPKAMRLMFDYHISAIITDYPDMAIDLRNH